MFTYVHEGALAFVYFLQVKKSGAENETLWDLLSSSCWYSPLLVCIASCLKDRMNFYVNTMPCAYCNWIHIHISFEIK